MTTVPLTPDRKVGYIEAEDVYIVYTEYYGDGTIYGRTTLLLPDNESPRGAGKCVMDLIAAGTVVVEPAMESQNGVLVPVPVEPTPPPPPPPPPVTAPYTVKLVHPDFTVEYKNVLSVEVTNTAGNLRFSVA
jgi:hypothetical protein